MYFALFSPRALPLSNVYVIRPNELETCCAQTLGPAGKNKNIKALLLPLRFRRSGRGNQGKIFIFMEYDQVVNYNYFMEDEVYSYLSYYRNE